MAYINFLAIIGLIGSIVWLISAPGFESAISVITFLSAAIAAFVVDKRKTARLKQNQVVSASSIGVQAGGDVKLGKLSDKDGQ